MEKKNPLYDLDSLKSVPGAVLDAMWEKGGRTSLPKDRTFIRAKEPVNYVYIILSGKVILYNLTRNGKRKIIFVLGKGTLVNEAVVNPRYSSVFCDTIEECTFFSIRASAFLKCMEQSFELTKAVLEEQERKIWRMGHQLKNTTGSIQMERKLAAKLWKLARDFGKPCEDGIQIEIKMTVTFLADLLGAPRETASRLCKILTEYGLMKMENRRITITDPDRMASFYKDGII